MNPLQTISNATTTAASPTAQPRFIIAGGGTGGHIFPAIAIAHAIKKHLPQAQILFVGAKGKMEMEKVPAAGFAIEGLTIAGFNRSSLLKNISLPVKLIKSFFQVRKIFSRFKPHAVIGVGGYSSFPVLKYAQYKNIKTFIHESNSFAGKSNKMLAKKATAIFTATAGMELFFPKEKIVVTGNPIRQNLQNVRLSKTEALAVFGLNPNKKTVLSVGGSLGAQSINEALSQHLQEFENNKLQLIWQTGTPYFQQAKTQAAGKPHVYVTDFINRMDAAYVAADVAISRSGAMAISELAATKKPAILVPYPFAAEDHQTENAKKFVGMHAALMVTNNQAQQQLVAKVVQLCKDESLQNSLATQIATQARPHADEKIVAEIFKKMNLNILV